MHLYYSLMLARVQKVGQAWQVFHLMLKGGTASTSRSTVNIKTNSVQKF